MSQLADIEKQLDRIEGKIDDLSEVVMEGFQQEIANTHTLQNSIDQFQSLYQATVADQTQRDAIKSYLSGDQLGQALSRRAQKCASGLQDANFDVNSCARDFAGDLSTKLFTVPDVRNVPTVSSTFANRTFSTGVGASEDRIIHEELSAPIFFAKFPDTMWGTVARNHEALASLSQYYFASLHPAIVTNPDALSQELAIFAASVEQHSDLRDLSKSFLINEGIERIDEINRFLTSTVGNADYLDQVWKTLAAELANFEDKVNAAIREATTLPTSAERSAFAGRVMISCNPDNTFELPSPRPKVVMAERPFRIGGVVIPMPWATYLGVETLVPDAFWVAQSLKLGGIGYCFEIRSASGPHSEWLCVGALSIEVLFLGGSGGWDISAAAKARWTFQAAKGRVDCG